MSFANPLCGMLDANKLTGPNFTDWYQNLRIILTVEKIAYVLEEIVLKPSKGASEEDVLQYKKYYDNSTLVQCYMLSSMSSELQRQHENMGAHEMLIYLCKLFEEQRRTQRYEISKSPFKAIMSEGTLVSNHVLKMIEWIKKLTRLGVILEDDLCVDLILQFLPDSFSQFIINFNLNKIDVSLRKLLNM